MYLPTRPASHRRGLSLLEVLVALAIFLLCFVAIGRLTSLASDRALDIEYQSQATRLAQSKLNEVIGGAAPLQGASGTFDEDDSGWHWTVDAQQGDVANLWTVTVTVSRPSTGGDEITSSVTQMILDPSIRGSVFDTVAVGGAGDTAPSGGSSASGGAQSSGGGGMSSGGSTAGGGNNNRSRNNTSGSGAPKTGGTSAGSGMPKTGGSSAGSGVPKTGGSPAPKTGGSPAPKTGGSPAPKTGG